MHVLLATVPVPYPSWLNPADNTWQITAATFVGLMSLPALAVLYASTVQKKWAVNVLAMMFAGFSLVLVAWVLWSYKMGFGATSIGGGVRNGIQTQLSGVGWLKHFFENFVGKPGGITNSVGEEGQAVSAANTAIPFHFPTSSLAYFQFVFAAITPLAVPGQRAGPDQVQRLVPARPALVDLRLRRERVHAVGRRVPRPRGRPRLLGRVCHPHVGRRFGIRGGLGSRPPPASGPKHAIPNNLVMAGVGAGILWLGWNGFNGGDPYYAGASMAAAVINTNLATAVGVLTWMALDGLFSKAKKPTFLGGVNGMICGLVAITPCAGWVNGRGAIYVGLIATMCRLGGLELPFQGAALLQGGRRPRGRVHPRHRRLHRRHASRHLRRPEDARVRLWHPQLRRAGREHDPDDVCNRGRPLRALLGGRAHVHRVGPPALGAVPSRAVGCLLVRACDLCPHEAHRPRPRRLPLQRRDSRGRRYGHPRRGGLPRRDQLGGRAESWRRRSSWRASPGPCPQIPAWRRALIPTYRPAAENPEFYGVRSHPPGSHPETNHARDRAAFKSAKPAGKQVACYRPRWTRWQATWPRARLPLGRAPRTVF